MKPDLSYMKAGMVPLITLDVDWASDSIIAEVADYLLENKIKSTWFITHDSPQIRKLLDNPEMFEVGINPNLDKGSTQGTYQKQLILGGETLI